MSINPLQYELFRIAAIPTALALSVLFGLTLTRPLRSNPVSRLFRAYTLIVIAYLVVNTLELSSQTEQDSLFWARAVYLFLPFLPLLWFGYAFSLRKMLRPSNYLALLPLLIIPIVTAVFAYSPKGSRYLWQSVEFVRVGEFLVSIKTYGTWFYVFITYVYTLTLGGLVLVLRSSYSAQPYYKRQAFYIIAGIAMPIIANFLYLVKDYIGLEKDYSALAFALSAFTLFYAIYRLDTFSLAPIARDRLVEVLEDGILVFDSHLRVIDGNPAASKLLGLSASLVGKGIDRDNPDDAPLPPKAARAIIGGAETVLSLGEGEALRHLRLSMTDLSVLGKKLCRLVLLRDETELRTVLKRVEELARRDSLTGLANHRTFMETARTCLSIAYRYGEPTSFAMFDLDNFKLINDCRGHAVGDAVLVRFAALLSERLRDADFAGRLGGDEFAVMFPQTDAAGAAAVCERLRGEFKALVFHGNDREDDNFSASISVGISSLAPGTGGLDELMAAADAALYEAKNGGRDRTGVDPSAV